MIIFFIYSNSRIEYINILKKEKVTKILEIKNDTTTTENTKRKRILLLKKEYFFKIFLLDYSLF